MTTKRLLLMAAFLGTVIVLLTTVYWNGPSEPTPGRYVLRVPAFQYRPEECVATIGEYDVTLVEQGGQMLLLPAEPKKGEWGPYWGHLPETSDVKKKTIPGWTVSCAEKGRVLIEGYAGIGEGVFRVKLQGRSFRGGWWKGKGASVMGVTVATSARSFDHHFEWSLAPKGRKMPAISGKVAYDGPPVKRFAFPPLEPRDDERLLRIMPPVNVASIRSCSQMSLEERELFMRVISSGEREYLKTKVFPELIGMEISVVPEVVILSDHLASLDVSDSKLAAKTYVRDGSAEYLKSCSHADLGPIPPAFLLVHCYPELDEAAKTKIKKGSPRFALILEETERHKDAPVKALDEIMAAVLTRMSPQERADYFRTSAKLKPYVAASKHEALRALLPKEPVE
jgi:hypothetical protein